MCYPTTESDDLAILASKTSGGLGGEADWNEREWRDFQRGSRLGESSGSSTSDSARPETGQNEFGRADGISVSPSPQGDVRW